MLPRPNLTLLQHLNRICTRHNNNKWLNFYYNPLTSSPSHSCQLRVIRRDQGRRDQGRRSQNHSGTRVTSTPTARSYQSTGGGCTRKLSLIITFQLTGPRPKPRSVTSSPGRNLPCFGTSLILPPPGHLQGERRGDIEVVGCRFCGLFMHLWVEELERKVPSLLLVSGQRTRIQGEKEGQSQSRNLYCDKGEEGAEIVERAELPSLTNRGLEEDEEEDLRNTTEAEDSWVTTEDDSDSGTASDEGAVEVIELLPLSDDDDKGE